MDNINLQGVNALVVDDDPHLCHIVEHALGKSGARVSVALTAAEALAQFRAATPDVVLLDIMLPEMDGIELCQHMLQLADVPIIMLTALDGEEDTLRGLACGAIDYITKPCSIKILVARVAAAVRRNRQPAAPAPLANYDDGYLHIDFEHRLVAVQGQPVKLTPIEYRLLLYLLEHAGRVVSLRDILLEVWGTEYSDSPNYVHVYISRLRSKIEPNPEQKTYFHNERGVGYRFVTY
ncbi:MAG: response regulator transcription factor [Anaerolineae bacterium]|jgi:DNA-binding response OmpR family regulator